MPSRVWKVDGRINNTWEMFLCVGNVWVRVPACTWSDIPVSWEYDSVRSYRSCLARDGRGGGVVAGGGMTKSPALQLLINKSCLVHLTWWSGWAQAVETRRSEFLQVTCQMWWYFHLFFMVVKTTKTNKQTNRRGERRRRTTSTVFIYIQVKLLLYSQ